MHQMMHLELEHILSTMGIRPLPSNTQTINNMHPPITTRQVCTFLELVGYYRKFIKDFTKIAKPLTLLTHHKAKFEWTPVHCTAFMMLKEAIIQAPILHYPDPRQRYVVYTDASNDASGAKLSQGHDGTEFPIAFLSHTLLKHKGNGLPQNRNVSSLLCHNQMELLPSRIWHHMITSH